MYTLWKIRYLIFDLYLLLMSFPALLPVSPELLLDDMGDSTPYYTKRLSYEKT
ncbi:hypothetical protein DFR37_1236 [Eoetvoesiella caeni]|uniref:Uncharacterized protein n=1 Tax=Eoetvoesiella caeni TaxID=645616 RepID=A0A366GZH4_9BURK|nr:hypothetical protein DFR37_1236 [Eoetvoesiella caeni]